MTIATATSDGILSARLVMLRGLRGGLAFFTDCDSGKGAELAANPRAAAVLHWLAPVHRQVRVAGSAQRVSDDERLSPLRPADSATTRPPCRHLPHSPTPAAGFAAGMFALADGSDMGGWLRSPCRCAMSPGCGPGPAGSRFPGTTSRAPLGVPGPLARSVSDLSLLLSV